MDKYYQDLQETSLKQSEMIGGLIGSMFFLSKYSDLDEQVKKRLVISLKESLDRYGYNTNHTKWSEECSELLNSMP